MGCCQSENAAKQDFQSEIVAYEKREELSNIFEDNFYIDSVERYNVKYKPSSKKGNLPLLNPLDSEGNNAYINGGSGASGGYQGASQQQQPHVLPN